MVFRHSIPFIFFRHNDKMTIFIMNHIDVIRGNPIGFITFPGYVNKINQDILAVPKKSHQKIKSDLKDLFHSFFKNN